MFVFNFLRSYVYLVFVFGYVYFYILINWFFCDYKDDAYRVQGLFKKLSEDLLVISSYLGVKYRVEGLKNLEEALNRGGVVWASKHQSTWETIYLQTLTPDLAIILKKSLQKIPLFGRAMQRDNILGIDRDAGLRSLRDILSFCKKHVEAKKHVLIFPEGHRTVYGEKVNEYQIGVAAIYEKLNVPVLPIALDSGKCWGRHAKWIYPGTICVRYLPIIEPGLSRDEFMKVLNTRIEDGCRDIALSKIN